MKRPYWFFRADGPTPEVAQLELVAPPIGAESETEAVDALERAVEIRDDRKKKGLGALGPCVILAQKSRTRRRRSRPPKVS